MRGATRLEWSSFWRAREARAPKKRERKAEKSPKKNK